MTRQAPPAEAHSAQVLFYHAKMKSARQAQSQAKQCIGTKLLPPNRPPLRQAAGGVASAAYIVHTSIRVPRVFCARLNGTTGVRRSSAIAPNCSHQPPASMALFTRCSCRAAAPPAPPGPSACSPTQLGWPKVGPSELDAVRKSLRHASDWNRTFTMTRACPSAQQSAGSVGTWILQSLHLSNLQEVLHCTLISFVLALRTCVGPLLGPNSKPAHGLHCNSIRVFRV